MERVPRVVYTNEFKEEAVKMVTEAGLKRTGSGAQGVGQYVEHQVLGQTGRGRHALAGR